MTATRIGERLGRHRPNPPLVAVLAGTVGLVDLHVWWWWSHRRGLPLFIDESGYLAVAIGHTETFRASGLGGLIDLVRHQRLIAPLVPMSTVPAQLAIDDPIKAGFALVAGFYGLLLLATYALARRIMAPWWAVLATLVVACVPNVVTVTRMYYFAVPSAALFTAAIVCLLRSRSLERPLWAIAGGVLLGLTAMSRTLMIALVPGVVVAAGLQAWATGARVTRRAAILGGVAAVALLVAYFWYARNFSTVVDYLRGREFRGPGHNPAPVGVIGQLADVFFLPLALVMLAAGIAAVTAWWPRRRGAVRRLRGWLAGPIGFITVVVLWSIAVFMVADDATGEWVPVIPALVTLAVAPLSRIPARVPRRALAAALIVVAVADMAMMSDAWPWLGRPRSFTAGEVGFIRVTDGRQYLEAQFQRRGLPVGDRPGRLPESYKAWQPFYAELASWAGRFTSARGQRPILLLAEPNLDAISNDLLLAARLDGDRRLGVVFAPPQQPLTAFFHRQLTETRFRRPSLVLELELPADRSGFAAEVGAAWEEVLEEEEFEPVRELSLPDGRVGRVWARPRR